MSKWKVSVMKRSYARSPVFILPSLVLVVAIGEWDVLQSFAWAHILFEILSAVLILEVSAPCDLNFNLWSEAHVAFASFLGFCWLLNSTLQLVVFMRVCL